MHMAAYQELCLHTLKGFAAYTHMEVVITLTEPKDTLLY